MAIARAQHFSELRAGSHVRCGFSRPAQHVVPPLNLLLLLDPGFSKPVACQSNVQANAGFQYRIIKIVAR
ncbi:MAG: hypothetical protein ABIU18_03000, partial [Novosphingobium sp.]